MKVFIEKKKEKKVHKELFHVEKYKSGQNKFLEQTFGQEYKDLLKELFCFTFFTY